MSSKLAPEGDLYRPRKRPGFFACSAAVLTALALAPGLAHADTIRFCVDKANPMMSTDIAVAKAVAAKAGAQAAFVMRNSTRDAGDDDDDLSGGAQARTLHKMTSACDLIMGFPVQDGGGNIPPGMVSSPAYVRTGFVVAGPGEVSGNFKGLIQGRMIGVLDMTPASTYFDETTMTHEHIYPTNDQLYGALMTGQVQAVLIWQPWLNQQLATHPQSLHVAELNMPYANWNVVALYPQTAQNTTAVKEFNEAVAGLAASRQLGGIVKPYSVPNGQE